MLLFASTILLSAFLLFLVQPIIAKQILPWFGGSAAVWTTCMVFFQVLLLVGYAYARLRSRASSPRASRRCLHIALLRVQPCCCCRSSRRDAWKPARTPSDPALRILAAAGATIGLPYFLLSTTGPLLQAWFARTFPERTVYRLFALSNLGSLIALLAFPFAIEPFATSRDAVAVLERGYALFVVPARRRPGSRRAGAGGPHVVDTGTPAADGLDPAAGRDYAMWLALSALGS